MAEWTDSLRIPPRPLYGSHSDIGWPSTRGAGGVVRQGNPGVYYDDNGRLYYQEPGPGPQQTGSLPRDSQWRRDLRPDDTLTYDPRKADSESRGPRSYELSRDTPRSSGRSLGTKHYDGYRRSPLMEYRGDRPPPAAPVPVGYMRAGPTRYVRDGSVIVEERIISHERPWIWPLFMITGLLMLAAGIVNALFCVDNHFYAYLWTPLFLVIFAIFGAVHKGVYRGRGGRWRNCGYIVMGVLTAIVVFVCCALLQIRLNHVTIQISEHGPGDYIAFEINRMNTLNHFPRVNLTSSLEENVWACYSIDWVGLILTLVAFAVLPSVVVIANNYYNSNHQYSREVEPFCRPALFNPYGQVSQGQAMAFFGIVIATAVHGNLQIRYQDYWLPVWMSIIPMVAGVVTAFALKRIGLRNGKALLVAAAILEVLSLLVSVLCIVILTLALYENIQSTDNGPIATSSYSERLLTASIVLFVAMDLVLLVGLVYALALLIRLVSEGCRTDRAQQRQRYAEDKYAVKYPDAEPDFVDAVRDTRDLQRF